MAIREQRTMVRRFKAALARRSLKRFSTDPIGILGRNGDRIWTDRIGACSRYGSRVAGIGNWTTGKEGRNHAEGIAQVRSWPESQRRAAALAFVRFRA